MVVVSSVFTLLFSSWLEHTHSLLPASWCFIVVDLFITMKSFLENVIHAGVCVVDKTCHNRRVQPPHPHPPPPLPSAVNHPVNSLFYSSYSIPVPSVMTLGSFAVIWFCFFFFFLERKLFLLMCNRVSHHHFFSPVVYFANDSTCSSQPDPADFLF